MAAGLSPFLPGSPTVMRSLAGKACGAVLLAGSACPWPTNIPWDVWIGGRRLADWWDCKHLLTISTIIRTLTGERGGGVGLGKLEPLSNSLENGTSCRFVQKDTVIGPSHLNR
jgi:hypothetical protein